ncbi:MAG: DNA damage-inducible protein DinB [Acidimicrobiales bacterium]|nr:MAG: DNA damage-inducible protein DinB [Acidimicrobiales bacterium]
MRPIPRPEPGEYAPYTVEYFQLVPDDVLDHMAGGLESTSAFFRAIPEERLDRPHRPGEWTVKEILQHISDDERIYVYRALRFARNDPTELPSFDQDIVAAHSEANARSLESLVDEYRSVRAATLSFFEGVPEAALSRAGTANGNPMSVRAAAFHIAGHEAHHLVSIRTNYLGDD